MIKATLATKTGGPLDEFVATTIEEVRTKIADEWLGNLDAGDVISVTED